MPPEVCTYHGLLMEDIGSLKAQYKNTAEDVCEIKAILIRWEAESKVESIASAIQNTKNKLIWGGMGTAIIAGISAGVTLLIKKFGGW